MIILLSIILFIVFSLPMLYWRINGGELFSPIMITGFLHIITIIPYLILLNFDNSILGELVLNKINNVDITVAKYVALQSIAYIFTIMGIYSKFANTISVKLPRFKVKITKKMYRTAFIVSFCIGFFGFVYMIQTSGGFNYLLSNIERRSSILSGNGYIGSITQLMTFSVILLAYSKGIFNTRFKNFFILLSILIVVIIESMTGARKDSVYLIFFVFLVLHYGYKEFKKIPKKSIIVVVLVVFYAIIMPLIRSEGGIEKYNNHPSLLIEDSIESASNSLNGISYVRHYMLIINEFNISNIWLGKSYLDLLYAPLPSSIYEHKPPIDDGVYLRTIAGGSTVIPPTPFKEMFPSSWPIESFGAMYMNFWFIGITLGMYLLGFIYKVAYNYMKVSGYSYFSILLYGHILLNFQLSNLRIVQALTFVFILFTFSLIFFGMKKEEIRQP
ncbi:O-antigen polymerase [Pseudalkalibacillus sp. A8]|uniref:O-antigen polymerase n=1 Tax=Pseudalkalibacillus sp. A8 TaxID=3382641 RepID=UPI0038B6AD83